MAFGFNPRYQQKIELLDITLPQFMIIAQDTVNYLGWNVGTKSESSFSARTKMSLSSYGEEISVSVQDGIATIESRCTGNQMMDWGKNRKNVEAFVSAFELLKSGFNAETLEERNAAWQNELAEIKASETAVGSNEKSSFLSLFIPRKGFAVTPILINLNILVFIIMVISGVSFL